MHDFAAGGAFRRLVARNVAGEFLIDDAHAGDTLVCFEAERSAADHLAERLKGIGLGEACRHDRAHTRRKMAQCVRQQRKWGLQPKLDGAVIRRRHLVHPRHQRLTEGIALAPACHRGDGVARQHLGAVMEHQPLAQGQFPGLAVIFGDMARHHLRAGAIRIVLAIQRIEHHERVVHGRVGADHRVQHGQVAVMHEAQRLCRLRVADTRGGQRGDNAAAAVESRVRRFMASSLLLVMRYAVRWPGVPDISFTEDLNRSLLPLRADDRRPRHPSVRGDPRFHA